MADNNRKRRSSCTLGEKLLFLAGILFCLTLITTALLGGLFARYTTSDTGSDSARVAKFGDLTLTETGDFIDGNTKKNGIIIPGVNLKKDVRVSFSGSEMATYVFVEITALEWQIEDERNFSAGNLSWSVEEDWLHVPGTRSTYYQALEPNTILDAEAVIAPLEDDSENHIQVSSNITEAGLTVLATNYDLTISIRVSVIQSGDFSNAEEAWAYLNQ